MGQHDDHFFTFALWLAGLSDLEFEIDAALREVRGDPALSA